MASSSREGAAPALAQGLLKPTPPFRTVGDNQLGPEHPPFTVGTAEALSGQALGDAAGEGSPPGWAVLLREVQPRGTPPTVRVGRPEAHAGVSDPHQLLSDCDLARAW